MIHSRGFMCLFAPGNLEEAGCYRAESGSVVLWFGWLTGCSYGLFGISLVVLLQFPLIFEWRKLIFLARECFRSEEMKTRNPGLDETGARIKLMNLIWKMPFVHFKERTPSILCLPSLLSTINPWHWRWHGSWSQRQHPMLSGLVWKVC